MMNDIIEEPEKDTLLEPQVFPVICYSHGRVETDEEFDARWVTYFSKPDIDAWELRKDVTPSRVETDEEFDARWDKAGPHKEIYPYLIQELQPTLSELGISTPEQLGMDKL
ncbi:hypothetical protein F7725_025813 [Dissostichus mawsoni]|uniref:Cytochrome c oxidase subunit 5A, mitochondrial n=1 Tax=Dissostichus mawsoni TaxID=36200 RepID=A0A7J5X6Q8_DISMA|nr:hypothetical protein F7725_025813 [Dissostichus mawsoni]